MRVFFSSWPSGLDEPGYEKQGGVLRVARVAVASIGEGQELDGVDELGELSVVVLPDFRIHDSVAGDIRKPVRRGGVGVVVAAQAHVVVRIAAGRIERFLADRPRAEREDTLGLLF